VSTVVTPDPEEEEFIAQFSQVDLQEVVADVQAISEEEVISQEAADYLLAYYQQESDIPDSEEDVPIRHKTELEKAYHSFLRQEQIARYNQRIIEEELLEQQGREARINRALAVTRIGGRKRTHPPKHQFLWTPLLKRKPHRK
jgi:hypothetical protein